MSFSDLDPQRVAEAVAATPPGPRHRALLEVIARAMPGLAFEVGATRDGWYRTGGIVTADGGRVTGHLRDWAETQGDLATLLADHVDDGYLATRLCGSTHYLVAPSGDGPLDFVQVEVDEIQERVHHALIDPGRLPDDLEDLIDPMDAAPVEPRPIGAPRYELRRVTDFSPCLEDGASRFCGDAYFRRFVTDWIASTASAVTRLHEHWVFTLVPYTDRFGEARFHVKPRPRPEEVGDLAGEGQPRGGELARLIHGYDRAAGYPMAWYFHLVAGQGVSHRLAEAVIEDQMGAYDYLPAKDLAVLRGWGQEPYAL